MTRPHTPVAPPELPEHQPVVDAFTDAAQADGERPAEREVDAEDMGGQGGD